MPHDRGMTAQLQLRAVPHRDCRRRPRRFEGQAGRDPLARTVAGHTMAARRTRRLPRQLAGYWADGFDWRAPGGRAQQPSAIPHPDRRPDDPLPAHRVTGTERAAADPSARLARIGGGIPRRDRPAERSARPRAGPRAGVSPRHPVPRRIRLLDPAVRRRLDRDPHRGGIHRADGRPRLRPVLRAGRRLRLVHRPGDGQPRPGPGDRCPRQCRRVRLHARQGGVRRGPGIDDRSRTRPGGTGAATGPPRRPATSNSRAPDRRP